MPVYDCGNPECDECEKAFGPHRDEAIAEFNRRKIAYGEVPTWHIPPNASVSAWADGEWRVLRVKDGSGSDATVSLTKDQAFNVAYILAQEQIEDLKAEIAARRAADKADARPTELDREWRGLVAVKVAENERRARADKSRFWRFAYRVLGEI